MLIKELKNIARQNNIKGFSTKTKPELIDLLIENNVLNENDKQTRLQVNYNWLKTCRRESKKVKIYNKLTGETKEYPSIYSAAKSFNVGANTLAVCNGKTWRENYDILIE